MIGDPSFKDTELAYLQTKETVDGWVQSIQGQLSRFLDFENGENKAVMVNNTTGLVASASLTPSVMSVNTSLSTT